MVTCRYLLILAAAGTLPSGVMSCTDQAGDERLEPPRIISAKGDPVGSLDASLAHQDPAEVGAGVAYGTGSHATTSRWTSGGIELVVPAEWTLIDENVLVLGDSSNRVTMLAKFLEPLHGDDDYYTESFLVYLSEGPHFTRSGQEALTALAMEERRGSEIGASLMGADSEMGDLQFVSMGGRDFVYFDQWVMSSVGPFQQRMYITRSDVGAISFGVQAYPDDFDRFLAVCDRIIEIAQLP